MGKRKKVKVSYTKKLAWLRKRHIIVKKGKVAKTTVNRLYTKFKIQKMPLSTPRDVAMGMGKRLERKIERYGADAVIRTPKGKITGKRYVRNIARTSQKQVRRDLPNYISPTFGIKYKNQHVRDEFVYTIRPPIVTTRSGIPKTKTYLRKTLIPDILFYLKIFLEKRGYLYKHHDIGALVFYNTNKFTTANGIVNPSGYARMPWIAIRSYSIIEDELFKAFNQALHIFDTTSGKASRGASIELYRVDVYISTKERATTFDELRKGL